MAQIRWSVCWAACESGLLATGWGGVMGGPIYGISIQVVRESALI
jgi:hypothetical protein